LESYLATASTGRLKRFRGKKSLLTNGSESGLTGFEKRRRIGDKCVLSRSSFNQLKKGENHGRR
jgi:hypothetical protein